MKSIIVALSVAMLIACSLPARAADLKGKTGVGYSSFMTGVDFITIQSLSVRHWIDADNGFELVGALFVVKEDAEDEEDEDEETKINILGVRYLRNMMRAENVNVYVGGQGEWAKFNSESGFGLEGFAGVEFFIPGLRSLGFSNEIGVQYLSIKDVSFLGTKGGSFMNFGLRYYF